MTDARLARLSNRALTAILPPAGRLARITARALVRLGVTSGATVKLWNGTAYVAGPVKVWNGTAYVDATAVKTWNGTTFV
jgi:hypothetical protein